MYETPGMPKQPIMPSALFHTGALDPAPVTMGLKLHITAGSLLVEANADGWIARDQSGESTNGHQPVKMKRPNVVASQSEGDGITEDSIKHFPSIQFDGVDDEV